MLIAIAMLLVAMLFLLWPLLAPAKGRAPSRREANLAVLRDEREGIAADVVSGVLSAEARDEALGELGQRAAADLGGNDSEAVARDSRPLLLTVALAALLPISVLLAYLMLGTPDAIVARPSDKEAPVDDKQIVAMVENLQQRMRERPDDAQGWQLLARSMVAMERFAEAAEAYANLQRLKPRDADVLADYADALAVAQGRELSGKPIALVREALAIDPTHRKALALAATEALNNNRLEEARALWQRLYDALPAEGNDRAQVAQVIEEIRQRAGAPAAAAPGKAVTAVAPAAGGVPAGTAISGSVTLAAALAAEARPGETLFIVARAAGPDAPRAPLAVFRTQVGSWPLPFRLDESMAMAPGVSLATARAVEVEARIAKGGGAARQAGDLVGSAKAVMPGQQGVQVVIDRRL